MRMILPEKKIWRVFCFPKLCVPLRKATSCGVMVSSVGVFCAGGQKQRSSLCELTNPKARHFPTPTLEPPKLAPELESLESPNSRFLEHLREFLKQNKKENLDFDRRCSYSFE